MEKLNNEMLQELEQKIEMIKEQYLDNHIEDANEPLKRIMAKYSHELNKAVNIDSFKLGWFAGKLDAYYSLIGNKYREENAVGVLKDYMCSEVFQLIMKHPQISFEELGEMVEVDVKVLNIVLDRLIGSDCVCYTRPGKTYYFEISSFGSRVWNNYFCGIVSQQKHSYDT